MQGSWPLLLALGILGAGVGAVGGFLSIRAAARRRLVSARERADSILTESRREADLTRKSAALEAKEEWLREKEQFDASTRERRAELEQLTRQIDEQRARLRRDLEAAEAAHARYDHAMRELDELRTRLDKREEELREIVLEQSVRLERISGLTAAEARKELWKNLEDEVRGEAARLAQRLRDAAARDAEREGRRLALLAIQRLAAEQSIESTVVVVPLPNDDMKGRIIGREGRNIRAFEMATGIDVIIDDTPEAVLLSGFDPVRREIARLALERLITDGRIHPGRIEEVVAKAGEEMDGTIREMGERAAVDAKVHGLAPEVLKTIGMLHFRTSSGQNVMRHSVEVSRLAAMIGAELGLDVETAKRAGLLHDIGKAISHEQEGPHAAVGMEFLRRHGESPVICEAVGAHHAEMESASPYPYLVSAADAISSARPGARRENIEAYVHRLEKLEQLAESFAGVERSFAVQAGREIRILVQYRSVTDQQAEALASDIARRIENELQYPGQIKVVVIREMRVVDYAR